MEEAEYVLAILRRTLKQVTANPQLFAPDAKEQIDQAIAYMEWVRQRAKTAKAA